MFRPQLILVAAEDAERAAELEATLNDTGATMLRLQANVREAIGAFPLTHMVKAIALGDDGANEQKVMLDALVAIDSDLDSMPFPARHLLHLEQYPLATLAGELQTTLLIGRDLASGDIMLRNPTQIISELRSIAGEHGIWHFRLIGPELTRDPGWTRTLLHHLSTARIGASWEARVAYDALTHDLLQAYKRAGCEGLVVEFDALDVLADRSMRDRLQQAVQRAHALGIKVRARIGLEMRYSSMPVLVDLSATFGLDEVRFCVEPAHAAPGPVADAQPALEAIAELARSHYRAGRGRQYFINRFGTHLGPILWRAGRIGLLGPSLQRYASGIDWPNNVAVESQRSR